jgi:hypothetical protein
LGIQSGFSDSYLCHVASGTGWKVMAAWRRAIELSLGDADAVLSEDIPFGRICKTRKCLGIDVPVPGPLSVVTGSIC